MNGKQLKNSILQWAIQGKLVPQDPNDEPASVLLKRIRKEKERLIKEKKIKCDKNASIIYRGDDNSYYEKILATGEVKCIDDEVPFEIPTSWSWARLSEVSIYIQRGKSPKYSLIKKYPVIAQKCNQWSGFSIDKAQFIEPESLLKYAVERILQDEDLMWNSTGLGTLGRMAVYYERLNPYELAVADSHVTVIRLFKPFMLPLFFYFFFASPTVQRVIEDKSDGSTKQKELSTTTVCKYLVPIPPRNEQVRIISKVTSLLPIIEKYGTQQEKLDDLNGTISEQIKKSVLQEAIQGKLVPQIAGEGTAQELLEQIKAEKLKLVKEGKLKKSALNDTIIFRGDDNKYWEKNSKGVACIDDEIPFEIPSTWIWCRLGDCVKIIGGYAFKSYELKSVVGNRVIRISDISENGLVNKNVVKYNGYEDLSQYLIRENDILIAMTGGTVGKSLLLNKTLSEPLLLNQRVAIIRNFWINVEYLNIFLHSPYIKQIINKKKNSTNDNISMSDLNGFFMPLPPIKEQYRIVEKIKDVTSIMSR